MSNAVNISRYTELVFILDRSGSMCGLERDTIGGYNSLIQKQKQEEGRCRLTTVLFDDQYELLHDRTDLSEVQPITEQEYWVRGMTALLDAVGRTIQHITAEQRRTCESEQADKVLFVITTDGMENASREYSLSRIRQMIEEAKTVRSWEFLFLGANIDAVETAAHFGIAASRAANYHADSRGTRLNYAAVSDAISHMRSCGEMDECWKEEIDADFCLRDAGCSSPYNFGADDDADELMIDFEEDDSDFPCCDDASDIFL